jgi:hypothetical protein
LATITRNLRSFELGAALARTKNAERRPGFLF